MIQVPLCWMSLSVSTFSVSYTDCPPGELLHILFLAVTLCRPRQGCSWCENTKGSQFTCRTDRPQTTQCSSPTFCFNVKRLQIPQCTEMHGSRTWYTHAHAVFVLFMAAYSYRLDYALSLFRSKLLLPCRPLKWDHAKWNSCIYWLFRSISLSTLSPPLSAPLFPSQHHGDM